LHLANDLLHKLDLLAKSRKKKQTCLFMELNLQSQFFFLRIHGQTNFDCLHKRLFGHLFIAKKTLDIDNVDFFPTGHRRLNDLDAFVFA